MKQVPLAFVLMSWKRKGDCKKVMEKIKNLLPIPPMVTRVVDNVAGNSECAPSSGSSWVPISLGQALHRKIGDFGLLKAFNKKNSINTYCCKLMGLPFLPYEQIPVAFYELKGFNHPGLPQFCAYIEREWISNYFLDHRCGLYF